MPSVRTPLRSCFMISSPLLRSRITGGADSKDTKGAMLFSKTSTVKYSDLAVRYIDLLIHIILVAGSGKVNSLCYNKEQQRRIQERSERGICKLRCGFRTNVQKEVRICQRIHRETASYAAEHRFERSSRYQIDNGRSTKFPYSVAPL